MRFHLDQLFLKTTTKNVVKLICDELQNLSVERLKKGRTGFCEITC